MVLSFADGNVAVLAGRVCFVVHRGVLARSSDVLAARIAALPAAPPRPELHLPDPAPDIARLLDAIYDPAVPPDFPARAALLRVLTRYGVHRRRADVLRALAVPSLADWEACDHPDPAELVRLARDIDAPVLLPAAMYDLARAPPSDAARVLPDDVLGAVLRGREHAARYLSTFIVNELEGRPPAPWCLRRSDPGPLARRACQIAFEAITFELLRDTHRTADPLRAMSDALAMQNPDPSPEDSPMRTCDVCRAEFAAAVRAAKLDFWRRLPHWFGVDVPNWG